MVRQMIVFITPELLRNYFQKFLAREPETGLGFPSNVNEFFGS